MGLAVSFFPPGTVWPFPEEAPGTAPLPGSRMKGDTSNGMAMGNGVRHTGTRGVFTSYRRGASRC